MSETAALREIEASLVRLIEELKIPDVAKRGLRLALDKVREAIADSEEGPNRTAHASTSPGPVNCQRRLMFQSKPYPRTCQRCGLAPCPFFEKDGSARP